MRLTQTRDLNHVLKSTEPIDYRWSKTRRKERLAAHHLQAIPGSSGILVFAFPATSSPSPET